MLKWLKAIFLLPLNALVIIPSLAIIIGGYDIGVTKNVIFLTSGLLCLISGLSLAIWTMFLFQTKGKGTAAPWDPPRKLVISGPYKHVRNPMITSVFLILAAEVLITNSFPIFVWSVIFFLINMIYIPFFEEKDLMKRFGSAYRLYKSNVPRWIPRLLPWNFSKERAG